MSALIAKIAREPAALVALITAGFALASAFGFTLTDIQTGAILGFLAAAMFLVRWLTTPSSEVAVQVVKGEVVAGPAAVEPTGMNVDQPNGVADDGVVASVSIKPELLT